MNANHAAVLRPVSAGVLLGQAAGAAIRAGLRFLGGLILMSVTHATALRTVLADAVDNYINTTGSGTAKVRLRASTTTVVDFSLANPAFGNAASGVITLNSTPITATAAASGVVDNGQVLDRNGTAAVSCSVTGTGGGGDIEVSNTNIASSQACSLNAMTYTAPV